MFKEIIFGAIIIAIIMLIIYLSFAIPSIKFAEEWELDNSAQVYKYKAVIPHSNGLQINPFNTIGRSNNSNNNSSILVGFNRPITVKAIHFQNEKNKIAGNSWRYNLPESIQLYSLDDIAIDNGNTKQLKLRAGYNPSTIYNLVERVASQYITLSNPITTRNLVIVFSQPPTNYRLPLIKIIT